MMGSTQLTCRYHLRDRIRVRRIYDTFQYLGYYGATKFLEKERPKNTRMPASSPMGTAKYACRVSSGSALS